MSQPTLYYYKKQLCKLLEIDSGTMHDEDFVIDMFISKSIRSRTAFDNEIFYEFNNTIMTYIKQYYIETRYAPSTSMIKTSMIKTSMIKETILKSRIDTTFYDKYVCMVEKESIVTDITVYI